LFYNSKRPEKYSYVSTGYKNDLALLQFQVSSTGEGGREGGSVFEVMGRKRLSFSNTIQGGNADQPYSDA